MKTTSHAHRCKDLKNHNNHCNIDSQTEDMCYKPHIELNPKKHKKDAKKKNMLAMDSIDQVKSSYDIDENIVCTIMKKEVNLSSLHPKEEKKTMKLFHIEIRVKKPKWMLYLSLFCKSISYKKIW